MVKRVAVSLATLIRADDEFAMLTLRHASALKASSTFDQLTEMAVTRNVTQMALLVENIAKESVSGDVIDEGIRDAMKSVEVLLDNIQAALTDEHNNDQKLVDEINKCFKKAKNSLAEENQNNEGLRGYMMKSKEEFNSCRKDTHEAYVNKINKCEELDRFIASLAWPKKKEEECIWDGSSKFGDHLLTGRTWYESNYESFLPIRKSCWDAVEAYKIVDIECDHTQSHFEIDTCTHRQATWTACNVHYSNACKECSISFDETVNEVECREKDRKVDWSSIEKIKCYVDVITNPTWGSPPADELKAACDANGENCLTNYRIKAYKRCETVCHEVDYEALVDGEKTYQVVGGVNGTHRSEKEADENRCTRSLDINFPQKEGCDPCPELPPYPCETEFVEEFYSQFQQNEWVHGIADDTKECAGYMHQEWSAYNMAECRPCPVLIGHDPHHHDAKCQAYGNEIRIQTDGGHDTWLNLNEIVVNGGAHLTASMSHTYSDSTPAANCVDGNEKTMCHAEVGGWISVKLKAPTCIEHIKVVNRQDHHSKRIVGGNIKIYNQGTMVWQDGFSSDQLIYEFSFDGMDLVDPVCQHTMEQAPSDITEKLSLQQDGDGFCSQSVTVLRQADFDKGTYRITEPGIYRLAEDITFHPHGDGVDDGSMMPIDGIDHYPLNRGYWLGFFAAITIETENVFLDLNGKTVSQSDTHHKLQRFFSVIELASKPFQAGIGPPQFATMTDPPTVAKGVVITGGTLGLSSHMGVHGNFAEHIWLHDLIIRDFETGGIQINGGKHIYVSKSTVGPSLSHDVPAATLSQANLFLRILSLVKPSWLDEEDAFKTLKQARDLFVHTSTCGAECDIFRSPEEEDGSVLPDGSALYGLLFHSEKMPVHDFLACSTSEETEGDMYGPVVVRDVHVKDLRLRTDEVVITKLEDAPVLGPAGDVVQLFRLQDQAGHYQGTVLSDAQFRLGAKRNAGEAGGAFELFGSTNIPEAILTWASGATTFEQVEAHASFVCSKDSMGHHNKGVVGVRLNSVSGVVMENVIVENLENTGSRSAVDHCAGEAVYKGNDARGVTAILVPNLQPGAVEVRSIRTTRGSAIGVELRHGTPDCYNSFTVSGVESSRTEMLDDDDDDVQPIVQR